MFYIIFPGGDRNRISIAEIHDKDEVVDYAVASRKSFIELEECIPYAKQLAKDNGKIYDGDVDGFLD